MKLHTPTELKLRNHYIVSPDDVIYNTRAVCVALTDGVINYQQAVDILCDNLKVSTNIVNALITLIEEQQKEEEQ